MLYINVDNLLGWAMIQSGLYGDYEKLGTSLDEILAIADESEVRYFVDAD